MMISSSYIIWWWWLSFSFSLKSDQALAESELLKLSIDSTSCLCIVGSLSLETFRRLGHETLHDTTWQVDDLSSWKVDYLSSTRCLSWLHDPNICSILAISLPGNNKVNHVLMMWTGMHPCAFMLVHMLLKDRRHRPLLLRFPMPRVPITDNSPSKNDFVLYGNISDGGCQLWIKVINILSGWCHSWSIYTNKWSIPPAIVERKT